MRKMMTLSIGAMALLLMTAVNVNANPQVIADEEKLDSPWTLEEVKEVYKPGLLIETTTVSDGETSVRRDVCIEVSETGPKLRQEKVTRKGHVKSMNFGMTPHWEEDGLMRFGLKRSMINSVSKKTMRFNFGKFKCWVYTLEDSRNGMSAYVQRAYIADKKYAGIPVFSYSEYKGQGKASVSKSTATTIRLADELPQAPKGVDEHRKPGTSWTYIVEKDGEESELRYTFNSAAEGVAKLDKSTRPDDRDEWGASTEIDYTIPKSNFLLWPEHLEPWYVDAAEENRERLKIGREECLVVKYRRSDSRSSWYGRIYYPLDEKFGGAPAKWVEWKVDPDTGKKETEYVMELAKHTEG